MFSNGRMGSNPISATNFLIKINDMIEIKDGESLMEYIRRYEEREKEMSTVSGIPKKYHNKKEIVITGGIEFIEKFLKRLPEYMKINSK